MRSKISSEHKINTLLGQAEREAFFRKIAMNAPGLTAVIRGKDTCILFANDAFSQFTGYADSLHDSKYFSGYLEPFQRDRFFQHLREVKERPDTGNKFVIYNLRDKVNESAAFYLYVSSVPVDAGDEDVFYIFMVPDKSRWGTPFTSFDTRELFLELFKAEDFGTFEWIIDADKLYWSAGLYLIYEIDREVKEMNFAFARQFFHKRDQDIVMEQIKAALRSGEIDTAWTTAAAPDFPADLTMLSDRTALIRAENVVPIFRRNTLSQTQLRAVNELAGVLDTDALAQMRAEVAGGAEPGAVAGAWLDAHPLGR